MAGLIFNFGLVGKLNTPDDNEAYHVRLLKNHPDPDFIHWTFGDYPSKGPKGNMKSLKVGDYIFFNTTLQDPSTKEIMKYFVAYMKISEIITLSELLKRYDENQLKILSPYCYNAHVMRYFYDVNGESSDCTLFIGNPSESKVIEDPIPFNRTLFQELFKRFNPELNRDDGRFNWFYNDPDYYKSFGIKRNKINKLLTDNNIINYKFKSPPYIPDNLSNYLKGIFGNKQELTPGALESYGYDFDCAMEEDILKSPVEIWESVPRQSIIDLLDASYCLFSVLSFENARQLASDFMQRFEDEQEFSYELYEIFLSFSNDEDLTEISVAGKMVRVHKGLNWLPLKLIKSLTEEELQKALDLEII